MEYWRICNLKKVAIIGSGISGICCAKILKEKGFQPFIYEKNGRPGGLVSCTREDNNILFHRVGGHVFNSKNQRVLNWFWRHFDKNNEFLQAKRNASIYLDGEFLNYPIENSLHMLPKKEVELIIEELLDIDRKKTSDESRFCNDEQYSSFKDFLLNTFGPTLCDKYFFPYNTKIWNTELSRIPLTWLEGKLPMPDLKSILVSNINKNEDMSMVHSTFYYPIEGGSQFIVDRLLNGLDIKFNISVSTISRREDKLIIDNTCFDSVIFTGDLRDLLELIDWKSFGIENFSTNGICSLRSNPTSNALCECDANPYSWVYFPSDEVRCHRAIMTGNFADSNNGLLKTNTQKSSCTVEFSRHMSIEEMKSDISKLPFAMKPIAFNYEPSSYIVHDHATMDNVLTFKKKLEKQSIYLCGRFAEWQYYNMDAAIASAMNLTDNFFSSSRALS